MTENTSRRTKVLFALCCAYFALRGIADLAFAFVGGSPFNFVVGGLMLLPVALYFARPKLFPLIGGILGLLRGTVNIIFLAYLGYDVWQFVLAYLTSGHIVSLVILFLPFVVGLYCLGVAISGKRRASSTT